MIPHTFPSKGLKEVFKRKLLPEIRNLYMTGLMAQKSPDRWSTWLKCSVHSDIPTESFFSWISKIGEVEMWFWGITCNAALCRTTNQMKIRPSLNLPRRPEDPLGLTGRYTVYYFNICSFILTFFFFKYIVCLCVVAERTA